MGKVSKAFDRERNANIATYGDGLRQKLNAHGAVDLINDLISGHIQECSVIRFNAARVALNKCLPDLQAIGVMITDQRGNTKEDIDAMLLEAGLKPDDEYIDMEPDDPELAVSTIEDKADMSTIDE